MRWRAQVVVQLRPRLGELGPSARVAICGGANHDRAALGYVLEDPVDLPLDPQSDAADVIDASLDAVVVWLVGTDVPRAHRERLLGRLHRALRPSGVLVVVDHNRPRTWWPCLQNIVWCLGRGVHPLKRPVYPVAREIQAAGFTDLSLRFALGERLQIVHAIRGEAATQGGRGVGKHGEV
jgi:SAM-dependent methyltransferase